MSNRDMTMPKGVDETEAAVKEPEKKPIEKKPITEEESEYIEKVFFEEDETVQLRDGKTYRIPPLGLKDARKLIRKLNTIDNSIILSNLISSSEDEDDDRYDELLEVLIMAFKPYYKNVTIEYLEEAIDLVTAKVIIDSMIGLNGLKKSLM